MLETSAKKRIVDYGLTTFRISILNFVVIYDAHQFNDVVSQAKKPTSFADKLGRFCDEIPRVRRLMSI